MEYIVIIALIAIVLFLTVNCNKGIAKYKKLAEDAENTLTQGLSDIELLKDKLKNRIEQSTILNAKLLKDIEDSNKLKAKLDKLVNEEHAAIVKSEYNMERETLISQLRNELKLADEKQFQYKQAIKFLIENASQVVLKKYKTKYPTNIFN